METVNITKVDESRVGDVSMSCEREDAGMTQRQWIKKIC